MWGTLGSLCFEECFVPADVKVCRFPIPALLIWVSSQQAGVEPPARILWRAQPSALSLLSHSELTSSTGKQALVAAWCMNSRSLGEGILDYLAILKCLSLNPTIPFLGLYPSDILRCM